MTKTVLAAGVFDFFHPGHRFFLESAKKLGEKLVVIIARDKNILRIKGKYPHHFEEKRKNMLKESGIADQVILGREEGSFLEIVKEIQPDILAAGYDQKIPKEFSEVFPNVKIVRIEAKNPEEWKSSVYREKFRY